MKADPLARGIAAGEAAASAAGGTSKPVLKSERMYVRSQGFGSSDAELRFLQRCGVRHKAAIFPFHPDRGWDLDELIQVREHHESFGITLDMSLLPIYVNFPNIIYFGKSPERDREIDLVCEMIRTASRAGIDSLRYNTCILPIDRTEREEGRGGYYHTAFRLDKIPAAERAHLSEAGRVTAEMHWERIEYLLERMIPVAAEFNVRMGNSQEDPPTPPGYKGVDKVLNDYEGMKRFIEIHVVSKLPIILSTPSSTSRICSGGILSERISLRLSFLMPPTAWRAASSSVGSANRIERATVAASDPAAPASRRGMESRPAAACTGSSQPCRACRARAPRAPLPSHS